MVVRTLTNTGDPIVDGSGHAMAGIAINFTLVDGTGKKTDGWDVSTGERVVPGPVRVLTDSNGVFTVALWPTSRGDRPLYWKCSVELDGVQDFKSQVLDLPETLQWFYFRFGLGASGELGSVLAPVAVRKLRPGLYPLPGDFPNPLGAQIYCNGSVFKFLDPLYDLLDFTLAGGVTKYYVSYATGTDSGAGTTSGAPWKTLAYAAAHASYPAVIQLLDEQIGYLSLGGSITFTGSVKIKGATSARRTMVTAKRESWEGGFSWVSAGSGCYKSNTHFSSAQFYAFFDALYRDDVGGPSPMTIAASSAACITTPNSVFWDGSYMYAHMVDGRAPDANFIYCESPYYSLFYVTGAHTVLFEDLDFISNTGLGGSAAFYSRNTVVDGSAASRLGMKNCLSYGAASNAFEIKDHAVVVMSDCHARYAHNDGFNYHSLNSSGTMGAYMTVYEEGCTSLQTGYQGWNAQTAPSGSDNGSTCHDGIRICRVNCSYTEAKGGVVADVLGADSQNYGITASESNLASGAMKACFWYDRNPDYPGVTPRMRLTGCAGFNGRNGDYLISATTTSGAGPDVRVDQWLGDVAGAVNGTLKDMSGTTL